MPVFLLDNDLFFPEPEEASPDGLLAVGGTLNEDRLLLAYQKGIFPWYNPDDPILWWSPDPRCLIEISKFKVSKSMRNIINRGIYRCTIDQEFEKVISSCAEIERDEQGTWITDEIIESYCNLHELGIGHSVEVWKGDALVGGLYGLSLGNMFFGESMFSRESNASKFAMYEFCKILSRKGFEWIDCQIYNDHLASLGAVQMPRQEYLEILNNSLEFETNKGSWKDWIDE